MIHNKKIIDIVEEKTVERPNVRDSILKILELESNGISHYKKHYKQIIEAEAERGSNEVREHNN